jgi:hypothetical protein
MDSVSFSNEMKAGALDLEEFFDNVIQYWLFYTLCLAHATLKEQIKEPPFHLELNYWTRVSFGHYFSIKKFFWNMD